MKTTTIEIVVHAAKNVWRQTKAFLRKCLFGVHRKIFIPFSVLSLILLLSLTFITSNIVAGYMQRTAVDSARDRALQFNYNLEVSINTMERVLVNLTYDADVVELFDNTQMSVTQMINTQKKLLNSIDYLGKLYSYSDIDVFALYDGYVLSRTSISRILFIGMGTYCFR